MKGGRGDTQELKRCSHHKITL